MATALKNSIFPLVAAAGLVLGLQPACSEGSGGDGGSGGSSGTTTTNGSTTGTSSAAGSTTTGSSSSSTGTGMIAFEKVWNFDTDLEGWTINAVDPPTLMDMVTFEHDPAVGNPAPGSAMLSVTFAAELQDALVAIQLAAPIDLTEKTLVANVKAEEGIDMMHPGGVVLFLKSGAKSDIWCDSGWKNVVSTSWVTLKFSGKSFDPAVAGCYVAPDAGPSTFDISNITQIGIKLGTGTGTVPAKTTIHIDSVGYY